MSVRHQKNNENVSYTQWWWCWIVKERKEKKEVKRAEYLSCMSVQY